MNTKLTLTIEQTVIEKAKKYASNKGRSLSDLIENYLKVLVMETESDENEKSSLLTSLKGSFKQEKELDYKDELIDILSKKYGK